MSKFRHLSSNCGDNAVGLSEQDKQYIEVKELMFSFNFFNAEILTSLLKSSNAEKLKKLTEVFQFSELSLSVNVNSGL